MKEFILICFTLIKHFLLLFDHFRDNATDRRRNISAKMIYWFYFHFGSILNYCNRKYIISHEMCWYFDIWSLQIKTALNTKILHYTEYWNWNIITSLYNRFSRNVLAKLIHPWHYLNYLSIPVNIFDRYSQMSKYNNCLVNIYKFLQIASNAEVYV